ncbi:hypothetical protein CSC62_14100 [Pseudoxanthomonas jiangsuensis]|uniref:hypothetical protein n=1 Tax=Pseudoxanthomonas jiangsuensis TaxID=619688 RepID=UPI0013917897|nr:hypothetical protein [Pseudoxanthomonas jiangsuensis]KAF1692762.1 hypothetical protein CSC62_14100 [Pseudoxanthomonas jiangsuensis]
MSKPTPTIHGAWRVRNGQLVDESVVLAAVIEQTPEAPLIASADVRQGGPGLAVPPADAPNPPRHRGRNKTPSKE